MNAKLCVVIAGLGLLIAAVPVAAHHAFAAEFDVNKPVKGRRPTGAWPSGVSNLARQTR